MRGFSEVAHYRERMLLSDVPPLPTVANEILVVSKNTHLSLAHTLQCEIKVKLSLQQWFLTFLVDIPPDPR